MAKIDPKILAQQEIQERRSFEYRQKINELMKEANDISKTYGVVLQNQLDSEGKVNNIIKNRVDLVSEVSTIKEEDLAHSEKAVKLNDKMKEIEKKIASARDKSGYFQRGFNHQILKSLKTDRAMLKVERDKEAAMKDVTELQKQQAEKVFGMFQSGTDFIKKIPGGSMLLEAVGFGDKGVAQLKKNMGNVAAGNMKFADAFKVGGKASMGMAAAVGGIALGIGLAVVSFAILFSIAKKFAVATDAMGEAFGAMGTQSNQLTKNLRSQRHEAIGIGKDIKALIGVTTTLSDQFGIGFEQASAASGAILDSSVAMGLSNDEGAKLYGTLMGIANLSQQEAEHLAESAYQMAAANNVNPSAVMRDMADSAETIAKFGAENLESITKAAVQAKKMGLGLKDVEKIADNLLDFQSSLNKEIEASIVLGKNLNFQKARELAMTGKLGDMMDEVLKQLGGEAEWNKLNRLERGLMADSLGVDVLTMQKLVDEQAHGVEGAKSFVDLLGKDGMATLTSMLNRMKQLGAVFIDKVGPEIEKIVDKIEGWMNAGGFDVLVSGATSMANMLVTVVQNLDVLMGVIGSLIGASIGFMVGGPFAPLTALIGAIAGGGIGYSMGPKGGPPAGAGIPTIKTSDFASKGGSHLVLTPKGKLLETNADDTVFATTKPEQVGGGGGTTVGLSTSNLEKQNDDLRREMSSLRRDMASYFGIGGSAIRGIGSRVGTAIQES